MALALKVLPMFPIEYINTEDYNKTSFFFKLLYFNVAIVLIRIRYYAGWLLAEIGLTSTGLTYSGIDEQKNHTWNRAKSSNPAAVELTHDYQQKVSNWNMSIQVWLRRYVYYRIYTEKEIRTNKTKGFIAQYVTLLVSSFWHGNKNNNLREIILKFFF